MNAQDQEQTAETEAAKAPWTPPEVDRLVFGSAEASDINTTDGSFIS